MIILLRASASAHGHFYFVNKCIQERRKKYDSIFWITIDWIGKVCVAIFTLDGAGAAVYFFTGTSKTSELPFSLF